MDIGQVLSAVLLSLVQGWRTTFWLLLCWFIRSFSYGLALWALMFLVGFVLWALNSVHGINTVVCIFVYPSIWGP